MVYEPLPDAVTKQNYRSITPNSIFLKLRSKNSITRSNLIFETAFKIRRNPNRHFTLLFSSIYYGQVGTDRNPMKGGVNIGHEYFMSPSL